MGWWPLFNHRVSDIVGSMHKLVTPHHPALLPFPLFNYSLSEKFNPVTAVAAAQMDSSQEKRSRPPQVWGFSFFFFYSLSSAKQWSNFGLLPCFSVHF